MAIDVNAVAAVTVNGVTRRFAGFIGRDDLQQEADIWLWQHESQIREKMQDEESEGATASWIRTGLSRHLERTARAYKAQSSGYEPGDEAYYGKGVLALVLPHVLVGDSDPPTAPPDGLPGAQNDPALGNTWAAMYQDVLRALGALGDEDVHLLVHRYHEDMTYDQIAGLYEMGSSATAHRAVRKAEGRLIEALGGYEPKGCAEGCTHWGCDPTLRRRPTREKE